MQDLSARQCAKLPADCKLIKTLALFGYLGWYFWLHRLFRLVWLFVFTSVKFKKDFSLPHSGNMDAETCHFHIQISGYSNALGPGHRTAVQYGTHFIRLG